MNMAPGDCFNITLVSWSDLVYMNKKLIPRNDHIVEPTSALKQNYYWRFEHLTYDREYLEMVIWWLVWRADNDNKL
jgi:hypothetical protein